MKQKVLSIGSQISLLNKKEFSTVCPIKSVSFQLLLSISVIFTVNQKIQKGTDE